MIILDTSVQSSTLNGVYSHLVLTCNIQFWLTGLMLLCVILFINLSDFVEVLSYDPFVLSWVIFATPLSRNGLLINVKNLLFSVSWFSIWSFSVNILNWPKSFHAGHVHGIQSWCNCVAVWSTGAVLSANLTPCQGPGSCLLSLRQVLGHSRWQGRQ